MKSIVFATLLASTTFAASAMSGNGEIYGQDTAAAAAGASKTRAEVVAELRQAQAAGTLAYGESSIKKPVASLSAGDRLTRAEVRMEVSELRQKGARFSQGSNNSIYRN